MRAAFLLFIVLYKLGDAFAGSLMTPFLLKSMAFSPAEVGVVNKIIGLWLTIGGALLGGALMLKLGLVARAAAVRRAADGQQPGLLVAGGQRQGPDAGAGAAGLRLGLRASWPQPTPVDGGLLMVIAFENLSGGMGTAAFVAFLMSLCNQRFTATQYALLSAPLPRSAGSGSGRWPACWPNRSAGRCSSSSAPWPRCRRLWMLWWLRDSVRALEVDPATAGASDD